MAMDRTNREALGRLNDEMKAMLNRCEREGDRGFDATEKAKWRKMAEKHQDIEEAIKKNEAGRSGNFGANIDLSGGLDEIRDTYRMTPAEWRSRNSDPHEAAFSSYLRYGMDALEPDQKQLMTGKFDNFGRQVSIRNAQTLTSTGGGYLVPTGFSDQLEEAMKWYGGIDGTVGKFKTSTGNSLPWPTVNDTGNKGRIIGQNVQVTETDFVFGQVTFNAYIGSSDLVLIPLALVEDSFFDIDALAARLLGERLGRLYNYYCTNGTGVSAGTPTGIVTAAVAAGNLVTLPSGFTTSISYSALVNLEHAVDPAYRYADSSRFMLADAMLKQIKLLTDSNGRPLWQPGLTSSFADGAAVQGFGGFEPTILGHKYVVNADFPAPTANSYSMLFGDLSKFMVREVGGTTVLRLTERYADYLQLGVLAFKRFDSQLLDAGVSPVAVLQQSAT